MAELTTTTYEIHTELRTRFDFDMNKLAVPYGRLPYSRKIVMVASLDIRTDVDYNRMVYYA